MTKGIINSFQSLGTLDGPGIRFVVFMQGCNLRCGCCHNPDTWSVCDGEIYTADEVLKKAVKYKEYFGEKGGITVSGGEPLIQSGFVRELFEKCHAEGINTCLDTSGSLLNDSVKELLKVTDRVLLDIKYSTDEMYRKYVGCGIEQPLDFLKYLNGEGIPVTLRQVIIPTLNDTDENIKFINELAMTNSCIDKIELLPFKKICVVKYQKLEIPFPFECIKEPSAQMMDVLKSKLIK